MLRGVGEPDECARPDGLCGAGERRLDGSVEYEERVDLPGLVVRLVVLIVKGQVEVVGSTDTPATRRSGSAHRSRHG